METDRRVIRAVLCKSLDGIMEQQIVMKEKVEELHIEIGLASEANESTPLLSKQRETVRSTSQASSTTTTTTTTSSSIYTKDCLNWRILIFFSMILTSLGLATYLLWRQCELTYC